MAGPRIILTTVGSLGDLHPFLAMGQALLARGAEPVLAVQEDYVTKCRDAGLQAEAILPSSEEKTLETGLEKDQRVRKTIDDRNFLVEQVMLSPVEKSIDRLLAVASGADAIVGSVFAFATPIAAEALAIPYIMAVLQPMSWFSLDDPPTATGFEFLAKAPLGSFGRSWNQLVGAIMSVELRRRYSRRINDVRVAHGLPKSSAPPILRPSSTPSLSLGLYSPVLGSLPPDAVLPAEIVGFPWFDSIDGKPPALDPELSSFLADGPAPLVVSLGSHVPLVTRDFYRRAAEIALELGMRAVLLTPDDPGIAEPNIKFFDYAPHSLLFPHAAAIVHHGGIGTMGQALRAGKPQLVIPFFGDQFDNARRMSRLGLGVSTSLRQFMRNGASLLRKVLERAEYRSTAASVASHVRLEDGAGAAADRILRFVAG